MTTHNQKHKMHWWVRLYRKLFGKHPRVYVKEEIKSLIGDEVNARPLNRLFRLGVGYGPKIIQCESTEEIQRVYNGE